MNKQALIRKLEDALTDGSGDALTDFMADHGEDLLGLLKQDTSEDHDVPYHQREDGRALAQMEMMYDGDADPEGGDLYDDRDNPENPCPACGDFCNPWEGDNEECDGDGNSTSEGDDE